MTNTQKMLAWLTRNGYKYETIVNNSVEARPIGITIDTDFYTGPYPDECTREAVASIKRKAAKLGLPAETHWMLVSVRVYFPA